MTTTTGAALTAADRRYNALAVQLEVVGYLPEDMRAILTVSAYEYRIDLQLQTDDPAEGAAVADALDLTPLPLNYTSDYVHHGWGGTFRGHNVGVYVLHPHPACAACADEYQPPPTNTETGATLTE